ncbi:hypothetical protein PC116_g24470 [Phytophthora cactorum]|uniref:Uncharacterized protein n=1 Tax=Phytophthora cactorum TaxID=29920 RepID=A0A8T0YB51_9STRA|nr:hypothetical protein Pcac1_g3242 [Phytophthora cactorum]KAG2795722.1 hypothetical protein PC111_g22031 [Phytophthora cactorum]KAG2796129.1 hypothetical protein PC112_g22336 [Phytophthora cactorum]KAG2823455.1 hypothetical protein PC113_g22181 [Phytophthora cactorum]KAG2879787.1 hypothetical protein PC114_g22393 [Phytophthora cactorum]
MSYVAATTSNTLAENLGNAGGAQACVQHHWAPMHIVSGSALIICQHYTGQAPLAEHLSRLYWLCERLAATLPAISWATIGVTTTRQPLT